MEICSIKHLFDKEVAGFYRDMKESIETEEEVENAIYLVLGMQTMASVIAEGSDKEVLAIERETWKYWIPKFRKLLENLPEKA